MPIMGKNNKNLEPFDLGCPHCGANLKVDAEMKAVIAHTPPVRPKTFNDFEEATRAMKEQDSRRESLFHPLDGLRPCPSQPLPMRPEAEERRLESA